MTRVYRTCLDTKGAQGLESLGFVGRRKVLLEVGVVRGVSYETFSMRSTSIWKMLSILSASDFLTLMWRVPQTRTVPSLS